MDELTLDAQHMYTAVRFTIWVSFLLASVSMLSYYLQLRRQGLKSQEGGAFSKALFGWSLESFSLSMHQGFWWAVEHKRTVGNCRSHDPLYYDVTVCAEMNEIIATAPYLTPIFYAGMLIGLTLILPPILVMISNQRLIIARIGVKLTIIIAWCVGFLLVNGS